jgi:hypothetical protein
VHVAQQEDGHHRARGEQELHRHLHHPRGDRGGHRVVHAVLDLLLERHPLLVVLVDGDEDELHRHAEREHDEEGARLHLVLLAVARLQVDDAEKEAAHAVDAAAQQVRQRLALGDEEVPPHQHAQLRAEAGAREHVGLRRLWRGRRLTGGAVVRLAAPLGPLVEQRAHARLGREVGVDEVEHELRDVGVGWRGIAHRGEVLAH